MKARSYEVPTKVLIAQARATENALGASATKPRRDALATVGIDANALKDLLAAETTKLEKLEADQERAKNTYSRETAEDRAIAEEGYRYKLALEARTRVYIASHEDDDDLRGRFRFGHLRVARARGVVYELRAVLPEVELMSDRLSAVGIDAAFVARGHDILARLHVEQAESAEAKKERERLTKAVREGELIVSRLLARLVAADEAIALERPAEGTAFGLDIIAAELGRQKAARDARTTANPLLLSDDD